MLSRKRTFSIPLHFIYIANSHAKSMNVTQSHFVLSLCILVLVHYLTFLSLETAGLICRSDPSSSGARFQWKKKRLPTVAQYISYIFVGHYQHHIRSVCALVNVSSCSISSKRGSLKDVCLNDNIIQS